MKIKNVSRNLLTFDLPSGTLFLAGQTESRELTDAEMQLSAVQRAIAMKLVRKVKNKQPVATPAQPVAAAAPNVGSGNK